MSEYVRCPYRPSLPPLFLAPVFSLPVAELTPDPISVPALALLCLALGLAEIPIPPAPSHLLYRIPVPLSGHKIPEYLNDD